MVKVGKWIAKHKVLVLLIGLLLVIPSVIGIAETRVNYDLLSYLPDTLETVKGQDILVDEFGMGAFSMVIVENMEMKDVQKLEDEFSQVEHVKDVLWYDDVADITLPVEMIPEKYRKVFEEHGVFSPAMIDGIINQLKTFNDRTLRQDIENNNEEIQKLVTQYFHCG